MERPRIEEIDAAAEEYREARDQRMQLTALEVERKGTLTELMVKHNLERYDVVDASPPQIVYLNKGKPKVKVRNADSAAPGDDDEE